MNDPIRLARPDVGDAELAAVAEVVASGMLTMGPKVGEFECALAGACGTADAVVVSSGTAALHLAIMALGIAWYYDKLTYTMVRNSLLSAIKVTAMIAFIIFAARLLSFVLQDLGATTKVSTAVLQMDFGKYGTMLAIVILYLVLGMFFDSMAMMLLTLSFIMPVIVKLGYDPVWWGVTFVLLAEIGLVTPPFGLNLFTIHGVLPKFPVMFIARASLPFLAVMILMVWILIFFPDLAMWLPRQLY